SSERTVSGDRLQATAPKQQSKIPFCPSPPFGAGAGYKRYPKETCRCRITGWAEASIFSMLRLSWKWKARSSVKIAERTYAKRAQALHRRRESSHPEATPLRQGPSFRFV